ncbi:LOW QUALITY PROTEIN: hypothetical protein U9M48_038662 [Paspalum notatum var. saurae]|uniref:Uncharacterized protein n=1 Tax=Paspalum notatum var. saurae TaxID=547442 RepID=A0AAQ3UHA4_PASNO
MEVGRMASSSAVAISPGKKGKSSPGRRQGRTTAPDWELRLHHYLQRKLACRRQPKHLVHAQLLFGHPVRQPPREAMEQVGQAQLYHFEPEVVPGAHPAAGPERQQLEVLPLHVHLAPHEPLRQELLRSFPNRRVPPDRPHIDKHARALGDVVAADGRVLAGDARDEQRHDGVHAHGLLDDGFEGRHGRSFSATHRPRPTTRSSSSVAAAKTPGFLRSSEMAHSTVTDELSVPPAIRSWVKALTPTRPSLTSSRVGSSASCISTSTMSRATKPSPSRRRRSLCSSRTCSMNASSILPSLFIRRTYPCRSSQSSHGIQSPMLSTPLSRRSSSSIHLNSASDDTGPSAASAPAPSPKNRLPSTIRVITFMLSVERWSLLRCTTRPCCCAGEHSAKRPRTSARTSSARMCSNDASRRALNTSVRHIRRAWRQYAP